MTTEPRRTPARGIARGIRQAGRPALAALVLLVVALAGCIGGSGSAPTDDAAADNTTPNITPKNVKDFTNQSVVKVKEDTQFDASSTVHPHDYWGERTSVDIIDGATVEIDWQAWARQCAATASCHFAPAFIVDVPVDVEDPRFVYPGTASLDVTLSWTSQGLEGAFDGFNPVVCVSNKAFVPNCRTNDQSTNASHVFASSGETWTIDDGDIVNRFTNDPPHALKSNWRFLVHPCSGHYDLGPCSPQGLPNVGMTELEVTVTIHRTDGDLPVDPPHFAFYGEADELAVLSGYTVDGGSIKGTQQPWMSRTTVQQDVALWRIGGAQIANAEPLGMSEQPVVPLETRQLTVQLQWTSGTDAELELRYRSAADNWQDPWQEPGSATTCGAGCLEYVIPVTKSDADSPYALQTQWEFGIFHTSDAPLPLTDYEVTFDVLAQR